MNTYLIQQKVESYAEIFEHDIFNINGYTFEHWKYDLTTPLENAWLVHKTISANNIIQAMNMFRDSLIPILNRASFVSQCGIQYQVNSIFVLKTNDNPENIFFMCSLHKSEEVSLCFQTEERESLEILMNMDNEVVFDFLTASNLSMTNHARLVPMILALEALSGEKEAVSNCPHCDKEARRYTSTDKEKIKEILGDDLYKVIYDYKEGLRNKLFHGKLFEAGDGIDYAQKVYEKIISFFNKKYKTKISEDVVGAPRNGLGKYSLVKVWAKPKTSSTYPINLRTLLPLFDEKRAGGFLKIDDTVFNQNFESIHPADDQFVGSY